MVVHHILMQLLHRSLQYLSLIQHWARSIDISNILIWSQTWNELILLHKPLLDCHRFCHFELKSIFESSPITHSVDMGCLIEHFILYVEK